MQYCYRLLYCCVCDKNGTDGILFHHEHITSRVDEQIGICRECLTKMIEIMNVQGITYTQTGQKEG